MEKLGITVSLTSGYHPQANGQAEHLNQEIGSYLRTYYNSNLNEWVCFLPLAEYAQNSLKDLITNLIPFQCILCYQPLLYLGMHLN